MRVVCDLDLVCMQLRPGDAQNIIRGVKYHKADSLPSLCT